MDIHAPFVLAWQYHLYRHRGLLLPRLTEVKRRRYTGKCIQVCWATRWHSAMDVSARSTDVAEDVYEFVKSAIIGGEFPAGTALSSIAITHRLGVSRTPVREALRRLQAEGLLDAERNRRMRVTGITPEDLDVTYATRIFLESMSVALTVPRMTASDLRELKEASQAIVWSQGAENATAFDRQLSTFKLMAMKYAGPGVIAAVSFQFERCERVRLMYQTVSPGSIAISRDEHNALLRAYQARDVEEAVFVASRHLGRTALAVLGYLSPDFQPHALRYALAQTGRAPVEGAGAPVLNLIGDGPIANRKRVGSKSATKGGRE
jgi:DNA-binding GntR family transcriptional regulator